MNALKSQYPYSTLFPRSFSTFTQICLHFQPKTVLPEQDGEPMTASAADVWSTLDSLVELYKVIVFLILKHILPFQVDVTNHYENGARERRGSNKNVQRFSYLGLAKKIFDPVSTEQVIFRGLGLKIV